MARDSPVKRLTTPGRSNALSPILFNSPALESLKHQQLRSLASRSGLSSKGKKDVLIRRLKALRNASPSRLLVEEDGDDDDAGSSDDDEQETIDEASSAHNERTVPLQGTTDEFGAVAASSNGLEHGGISKSSSWRSLKSLASRVFGENIRPLPASGSSRSLSSQATMTTETDYSSSCNVTTMLPGAMPVARASMESVHSTIDKTCEYRIIDDTMPANATVDASFVPRPSFEDDSIALDNVQAWPPRPASPVGVILVSPCKSPAPRLAERAPQSSAVKRRYTDFRPEAEDEDEDEEARTGGRDLDSYFTTLQTIRLVPPSSNTPVKAINADSAMSPGRRIAGIPRRLSSIASSPPRFDADAPQLPSFAMALSIPTAHSGQASSDLNLPGKLNWAEQALVEESALPSAPAILSPKSNQPMHSQCTPSRHLTVNTDKFVFGSPQARDAAASRQAFTTSAQKLLGDARQRMLDEMGKRGDVSPHSKVPSFVLPSTSAYSAGVLPSTDSRYMGDHDKNFSKMDSIANHYAIKRTAAGPTNGNKRTKIAESTDATVAMPVGQPVISRTSSMQKLAGPVPVPTPKVDATVFVQPRQPQGSLDSRKLAAQPRRVHGSPKKLDPRQRRLPLLAPASPPKQAVPAASTTGSLLKRSFNSLRSLASVSSLSSLASKASVSTVRHESSMESALASAPRVPTGNLSVKSTSSNSLSSFARPTAASLNRTTSIGWLRQASELGSLAKSPSLSDRSIISSPKNDHPSAQHVLSLVEQDKLSLIEQLPSVPTTKPAIPPRTTKTHPSLLIAPSPKKRLSTASQAQRGLGSVKASTTMAEERLAAAKRLRIKQDRFTADASHNSSTVSRMDALGADAKLTRNSSVASRGGSLNARPLWR